MSTERIRTTEFDRRIAGLRAKHGDRVQIDDVANVVESMMGTLMGDLSAADMRVHEELTQIVDYIQKARAEIAQIKPADLHSVHIPTATDELDAVVEATAEATNIILDAAEQIGQMVPSLPEEQGRKIEEIVTRIFEASNFQDITGQRITKVVRTLRHIEERVVALARAMGEDIPEGGVARQEKKVSVDDEASLLNGPQLPTKANSQEDIDALLASFD